MATKAWYRPIADEDSDMSDDNQLDGLEDGFVVCEIPLSEVPSYNLIYAHPESLISTTHGRRLLHTMRKEICVVAVDEAHIIHEWYSPTSDINS